MRSQTIFTSRLSPRFGLTAQAHLLAKTGQTAGSTDVQTGKISLLTVARIDSSAACPPNVSGSHFRTNFWLTLGRRQGVRYRICERVKRQAGQLLASVAKRVNPVQTTPVQITPQ